MEPVDTLTATEIHSGCINLDYLRRITKSNPEVMTKIMALYLKQVPPLIASLRKGYEESNWKEVFEASHQLIPSFAIVGINREFELISKKIQTSAAANFAAPEMNGMIHQLEVICSLACSEIESELVAIGRSSDALYRN